MSSKHQLGSRPQLEDNMGIHLPYFNKSFRASGHGPMTTRKQCCIVTNGSVFTFYTSIPVSLYISLFPLAKWLQTMHMYMEMDLIYMNQLQGTSRPSQSGCLRVYVYDSINCYPEVKVMIVSFTTRLLKSIYVYDSVNFYPEVKVMIVSFRLPVSSKVSGVIGTAIGHFLRCLKASVDTSHLNIGM